MKALHLTQIEKATHAEIIQVELPALTEGQVRVQVAYSSLNYKDGLAITGKGRVVTQFPMIPGIDFSGVVVESQDSRYQAGDAVILTGWGVGEGHWGGMAEFAQVPADWLVPMPSNCDDLKAMQIGTAGLTAMLCVQALQNGGVKPESGAVLVTGASGGVGSVAVTLLAKLGYEVVACTGRVEQNEALLKALGAQEVIVREELARDARPLEKQIYAGVVDTVGGQMLATAIAQVKYDGVVAACGLAADYKLPTTVMPFILRGVRLQGVDSVYVSLEKRQAAWAELVNLLPENFYQQATKVVALEEVIPEAEAILKGQVTGRVVVKP